MGGHTMPDKELKNRVRFSTTLSIDVERALKEYSKKTDIPVSKIVDKAISEFLNFQKSGKR